MSCPSCGAKKRATPSIQQMIQNVGILPYLEFSYCAFPDQFTAAFAKVGMKITKQSDLQHLAFLYNKKYDIAGAMKDDKGNVAVTYAPFSVANTLMTIDTSVPENANCSM